MYFDDFSVTHTHSPVVQRDDYYPFGLTFNTQTREDATAQRWKFQGQEHVDDLGLNWDSFKWRNHQPDIGRFFNVDPLAEDYYYNSPYAFSENKVTTHVELEGLEAFFIHGTRSSPSRWNPESVSTLMNLTNNNTAIGTFSWEDLDGLNNNSNDRYEAAERLVEFVKANRVKGEEVTLIGHSHGGNVSIQAAKLFYKEMGESVNLITIATPAYNSSKDASPLMEDPNTALGEKAIFHHLHLFNRIDGVQGGLRGEDTFNRLGGDGTFFRSSAVIDVSDYYRSYEWIGAHSFDVEHPESIQKAIESGKLSPLLSIPK